MGALGLVHVEPRKKVEEMSKQYPTRNDLPEAARREVIGLLNANLADSIHLTLLAKQAHWNVKGPAFFPLHELFDKLYDAASGWTDLMAERSVQLGGVAESTLKLVSQRTRLPGLSLELSGGREHLEGLAESLAGFGKSVRAAIDASQAAGDADTADLFTEVSRGADKMLWFLEAHLQAER
jgi:starvation-inducible DNA-binding protein